jgi:hypothetical protein
MGLMAPKIESAEALKRIASEASKPWYKKPEVWIGVVANIIALGALTVAIIAIRQ